MANDRAERSQQLKNKIQASFEQKKEEQKKEMFRRRIDLARQGLTFYRTGKFGDAVQCYQQYLKILEDWKQVGEKGLKVHMFDPKADVSELLLICGVYWDLAKLHDRTRTKSKLVDFRHYLQQYVNFSKGMPYQGVSMETMRKYMRKGKTLHTSDFRKAYFQLSGSNCFIATELVEYLRDDEIDALRLYRDQRLSKHLLGRGISRFYALVAPGCARILNIAPTWVRVRCAGLLRFLADVSTPGILRRYGLPDRDRD